MRYPEPIFSNSLKKRIKQINKTQARKLYEAGETVYLLPCLCSVDGVWVTPYPIDKEHAVWWGDYLDFASTEAEEEEAQNAPDYPDWIGERIYDHLLKEYGASDLMEALFEDDNGHENLTDFPTKEQFRDEMMRVHKKSEEQ